MGDYATGRGGHRTWTNEEVWAETIDTPCPHCLQPGGSKCRNKINDHVMPVPHWHRIQAAEKAS